MALIQAPFLMDNPNVGTLFAPDAIARAKKYLSIMPGGVGNTSFHLIKPNQFAEIGVP